jgi:restriction system protein
MSRRRKKNTAIDLIVTGSWKISAFFAVLIFIVLFFILPQINNPILKTLGTTFKPLGLIVIGVLLLTSLFKFMLQKNKLKTIDPISEKKPIVKENKPKVEPQSIPQNNLVQTQPKKWTLKLIQEIEWKKFEELSTAFYLEKGIHAEATSLGADGGIDIKLYQDDTGKPTSLVQCKAWYNKQVGVKEIREFLGVLTNEKIAKGFYMTSGEFSEDAKGTAKNNRITLINGEMFLMMIERLSDDSQMRLLELATAGDYKTQIGV